jgi:methylthioribose-1-phosphate isomerase
MAFTYFITSGNTYSVQADSEDEALAIFHVSQGNEDADYYYPTFDITEAKLDSVDYQEADTVVEFVGN